jgi:hypothetical protein
LASRQLPTSAGPVLDMGIPAGAWAELMHRKIPELQCEVREPAECRNTGVESATTLFDQIYLFNGIRRMGPYGPKVLAKMLRRGGHLVVVDIFADSRTPGVKSAYMLDWFVHGILFWTRMSEMRSGLQNVGFRNIRSSPLGVLFDMVVAEKSCEEEETNG